MMSLASSVAPAFKVATTTGAAPPLPLAS